MGSGQVQSRVEGGRGCGGGASAWREARAWRDFEYGQGDASICQAARRGRRLFQARMPAMRLLILADSDSRKRNSTAQRQSAFPTLPARRWRRALWLFECTPSRLVVAIQFGDKFDVADRRRYQAKIFWGSEQRPG